MSALRHIVAMLAAGLFAVAMAAGCARDAADEGTPEDWLEDGRHSEREGAYYQEQRENAPLGALEYYEKYLDAVGERAEEREQLVRKVQWLRIVKLMSADHFQGKADYAAATRALEEFRRAYPDDDRAAMALFLLAVAKESDVDQPAMAEAIVLYRRFIADYPGHDLVPEAWLRIGHCYEFDLRGPENPGGPKLQEAVNTYTTLIEQFGPTDDAVAAAPLMTRLAVEQAIYNKATILDLHLAAKAEGPEAAALYSQAAECYRRLTGPVFFDQVRFTKFQFVTFRLGTLLAEKLGRPEEGKRVLRGMADRWSDSPWFGRVKAKIEEIDGRTAESGATGR
ncbi:MAG TPA: outer membrane protein assembly factor BamD [Phycisphaerae bacterium]|nr:outer membrane protein assembly factor BamD [Phycisphaerae bacterium]